MIDAQDNQTITLPLEEKRGRGRPKTGKALTPAEKQRAYRERNKVNSGNTVTNKSSQIENLLQEIEELKVCLGKEVAARKKAELGSRKNVTEIKERTWTFEGRSGSAKWQKLAAGLTEKEASRQLDRAIERKENGESKGRQYRMVEE